MPDLENRFVPHSGIAQVEQDCPPKTRLCLPVVFHFPGKSCGTCCPHSPQAAFVVTSSHWIDISCAWFGWARSIVELDVKGDDPYECDRAANRRRCGVLRSGNHFCLLAHGN